MRIKILFYIIDNWTSFTFSSYFDGEKKSYLRKYKWKTILFSVSKQALYFSRIMLSSHAKDHVTGYSCNNFIFVLVPASTCGLYGDCWKSSSERAIKTSRLVFKKKESQISQGIVINFIHAFINNYNSLYTKVLRGGIEVLLVIVLNR